MSSTEELILRGLVEYPQLRSIVAGVLTPADFSTVLRGRVFSAILGVSAEGPISQDVLLEELGPGAAVTSLVGSLYSKDPPPYQWIAARVEKFVKSIRLRSAVERASRALEAEDVDLAEKLLAQAISFSALRSPVGNDLETITEELEDIAFDNRSLVCPTRIYALDDCIGGLYRKELFVVMAPLNVGKTWSLVHFATSGLLSGRHVLFLTLEMSAERIKERFVQNVSGMPRSARDAEGRVMISKEVALWDEAFEGKVIEELPTLARFDLVSQAIEALRSYGGKLSVVEYANAVCTVGDIEREVKKYIASHGRPPDLLIVDAITDIALPKNTEHRVGLTGVAQQLRRIAVENDLACVVSHQANRQAMKAKVVEATHSAESLGVVRVADTGISINQSKSEYENGVFRIFLMRARNQKKWSTIKVWSCLEIGQFCLKSEILEEDDD